VNISAQELAHNVRLPARFGKRNNLYKFWKLCSGEGRLMGLTKNALNQEMFNQKENDERVEQLYD